jgi:tetratricopeptide (TPR) repeat protein
MKSLLILVGLVSTAALAQQSGAPGDRETIVVTGIQPAEARARLEACLARSCPPLEDVGASLQYAEALFVAGDYEDSASVLRRSLGRNRRHAERHPVAVSGLYRAQSRVAIHLGDGDRYRTASYGVLRALKAGLDDDDPQLLGARLEAADMHVSLGETTSGEQLYRAVARSARALGRADVAAMADLRRGQLYHRLGRSDARELIEGVAASAEPRARIARYAALIALARMDRDEGRQESSDRLIQQLVTAGFPAPVLVYSPPIEVLDRGRPLHDPPGGLSQFPDRPSRYNVANMEPTESFDYWADIGFWVMPDGRVQDVEVLRSFGPDYWQEPVLRSVRGRIYAPAGVENAEAAYRIQRYSYTSLLERRTGTRIAGHSAQGRIEILDLSPEVAGSPHAAPNRPLTQ